MNVSSVSMKKIIILMSIVVLCVYACAGPQTVKPYAVVKASAEEIMKDATLMHRDKIISDAEFAKVGEIYDRVKKAQDVAIDTRKIIIKLNQTYQNAITQAEKDSTLAKINAASDTLIKNAGELSALVLELQTFATEIGIKGVK